MAEPSNLNLPPIADGKTNASDPAGSAPLATETLAPAPLPEANQKTYMVGAGIVIVLALVLLFFKRGYANYLISKKRSPNQSDTASWALFGTLLFPVLAIGLGYVKGIDTLMSLPFLLPLVLAMLVCLVLTVLLSRKK
jgi:membrane protease YdiL (CAAX protease family)